MSDISQKTFLLPDGIKVETLYVSPPCENAVPARMSGDGGCNVIEPKATDVTEPPRCSTGPRWTDRPGSPSPRAPGSARPRKK